MSDTRKEILELAARLSSSIGPYHINEFERARIVAALYAAAKPAEADAPDREGIARCLVNNDPNYALYHMPGDLGRKVEYQSGWIGVTHSLSEDEAERVRVRADAILSHLSTARGK